MVSTQRHRRHLGGASRGTAPPPPTTFPHYIATNATLLFCNPILLSTKCIKGTDPKFVLPECTRIDF